MARILAIDYGKKRTGLAVSDELQLIAGGLTTVATATLVDFLLDYVKKEPVERIIVGLPKQMNNTPSENMCRIEPFVNRLRKLLPEQQIQWLTSEAIDDEVIRKLVENRLDLDVHYYKLNRELVSKLHAAGITVNCWTCDSPEKAYAPIQVLPSYSCLSR